MILKAAGFVLKREGWIIPFLVLLVAISAYWREGEVTLLGLFASGLMATAVLLMAKLPDEIKRLKGQRGMA